MSGHWAVYAHPIRLTGNSPGSSQCIPMIQGTWIVFRSARFLSFCTSTAGDNFETRNSRAKSCLGLFVQPSTPAPRVVRRPCVSQMQGGAGSSSGVGAMAGEGGGLGGQGGDAGHMVSMAELKDGASGQRHQLLLLAWLLCDERAADGCPDPHTQCATCNAHVMLICAGCTRAWLWRVRVRWFGLCGCCHLSAQGHTAPAWCD